MTTKLSFNRILQRISDRLGKHGIDLETDLEDLDLGFDLGKGTHFKVVCVSPDLKKSVDQMGRKQRDQVVMVRVDEETLQQLDDWVAIGAVKSRSEAAALFIREGLSVRSDELDQLRDALREVEAAQERLKQKAREVFGDEEHEDGQHDGDGEGSEEPAESEATEAPEPPMAKPHKTAKKAVKKAAKD